MEEDVEAEGGEPPGENHGGDGEEEGEYDGWRSVLDLLTEVLRAVVSEGVGDELSRFVASYEAARQRLRVIGVLTLTLLVMLLLAAVVWLLVGVVFLADRFPATGDPLVFGVGLIVGYALAVVAGLVYSR